MFLKRFSLAGRLVFLGNVLHQIKPWPSRGFTTFRISLNQKRTLMIGSLKSPFKQSLFYTAPFWLIFWNWSLFANETASKKGPQPNALEQFFPFILLGLLFYFLLIRPQQRRHKQHGSFLSQIKRGDEVLTNSGIYGRIEGLTDSFVILEIAEGVRIRVVKSQIASWTKSEKDNKSQKTS